MDVADLGPDGNLGRPQGKLSSLAQVLELRARTNPGGWAYSWLADGEREQARLTYAELDARARSVAALLAASGARGERVLLVYPPGLDFVAAFFGCLYAGAVAVPTYPPGASRSQPRLRAILADARPRWALTTGALASRWRRREAEVPEGRGVTLLVSDGLDPESAASWAAPAIAGAEIAFLQYTSGSTSDPKGVVVSHANLLHNQEVIRQACGHTEASTFVSWLPVYHDMGLIGGLLQPLYIGAPCVLLSPLDFLRRPLNWLRAISRFQAHTSGAPNFAYELCVRKIPPEQRRELRLDSWRVAFNGSEPVRARTLEEFAAAFAGSGFRREALYPCYGLAEATLFVTGPGKGVPPRVRSFRGLEEHRAEAAEGDEARGIVSCGRPWLGQRVAIVDPEGLKERMPGEVGEIWVAGPSVAQGYWNRPVATGQSFGARLVDAPEGPAFLRTGDLGFLLDGELYVTGRLKDLIIVRGRNHYPQDLEETAQAAHPAVAGGAGAAFAVEAEGSEAVMLVQEVRAAGLGRPELWAGILETVRREVSREHEVPVEAVVLVRPGAVPKTTSGKVRRRLCRELLDTGALEVVAEWRARQPGPAARRDGAPAGVADWLAERLAARLGVPAASVPRDEPLARLGLDSLAAVELAQEIEAGLGASLPLAELLQAPGLDAVAARIAGAPAAAPAPEEVDGEAAEHPLSPGQRALWFLERLEPGGPAYHLAGAARLGGPLDPAALRRALEGLVDRHPALRTTFGERDGEPFQRLEPRAGLDFSEVEAAGWSADQLARVLEEEAFRPFDLECGPLLRVRLLRRAPGEHVLLLGLHHLVGDLGSAAVLLREAAALYVAASAGAPAGLDPLVPSFGPFARRQSETWAGGAAWAEERWEYWRARLAGVPPVLDLPTDHPRPGRPRRLAFAVPLRLDAATTQAWRALGRERGTTLFAALLALFQGLLHRLTGEASLVVGAPVSGRDRIESAGLVGYVVNPVPLLSQALPETPFSELLERTGGVLLEALAHEVPLPLLVERLRPEREPGRPPLFQGMLAFQQVPGPAGDRLAGFALGEEGEPVELGGFRIEPLALRHRPAPLEVTLHAAEVDGEVRASLQCDSDLFDRTTAARWAEHLRNLAGAAVAAPDCGLWDLPLLSPPERWQLLGEWSGGTPVPAPELVHDAIAARAATAPDARAVAALAGGFSLTYAELDRRARRLAGQLRRLGVGPEVRVGVCLPRSPEMVVGLLGVLEAGGAYVPLDPSHPAGRLELLVAEAGISVLLTERPLLGRVPRKDLPRILLEEADGAAEDAGVVEDPPPEPGNLAYILYTSGSAGRPKGVAITHASASALVRWAGAAFDAGELAGVLASTSTGFDLSVFELFVPLAHGGTVVVAENALELAGSPPEAGALTLVNTVPSAAAELLRAGGLPPSARTVNLAGEALAQSLAEGLLASGAARVLNLYGPTEDTTYSTFARVEAGSRREPAIGRPLDGTRTYVLAEGLRPVPAGVYGELCLGGAGLARGYLERPDLTAERFVPDPFAREPGARLYRTGDRVRQRSDGSLEFRGRLDGQVKVRGFRIEPGEIEAHLVEHPAVREAAVVTPAAEPGSLLAWVAPARAADAADLSRFLRGRLPAYMVPTRFAPLERLPRTPNGKVDRRALVRLVPAAAAVGAAAEAPRSLVEEVVAGLWSAALGRERIDVREDFFELGGHSLLALRVLGQVRELLGAEVPLTRFLASPTIAGLAAAAEEVRRGRPSEPIRPAPRAPHLPASSTQRRLWFLDRLQPGTAVYNLPLAASLSGPLSAGALGAALEALWTRHEVLRTTLPDLDGRPVQRIAPAGPAPWAWIDLAALPASRAGREGERLAAAEARRPFDLAAGPLARAAVLQLGEDRHLLVLTAHHTVCDGRSLELLLRDLAALYTAAVEGVPAVLPELPVQFADYAVWEEGRLDEGRLAACLARLAGAEPLDLPLDRPRATVPGWRGGTAVSMLTPAAGEEVAALARRGRATPFMVLLAAFQALLGRVTGARDVPVGTPVTLRDRAELEQVAGPLFNTLVLRARLADDLPFRALVGRVRAAAAEALQDADLPLDALVERLRPERGAGHAPLFQVMFAVQPAGPGPLALGGTALAPRPLATGTAKLDLSLFVRELDGRGLEMALEYALDLFEPPSATRLLSQLEVLLAGALRDPDTRLSELPLLGEAERFQLLVEWNDGRTAVEGTLHDLVVSQAERTPDRVAVVREEVALSYGELVRRARGLAGALRLAGAGPEALVGICHERSPSLAVAVLAVLSAGAAYLPLDPSHPDERLAAVAGEAGPVALLGRGPRLQALAEALRRRGRRCPSLDPDGPAEPGNGTGTEPPAGAAAGAAYVIYTSGSTGRPKGVVLGHRGAANRVAWAVRAFTAGELAGTLASTSLSFDLSVFELFVPWAHGGTVVLARDLLELPLLAGRDRVTLVNTVPSALSELLSLGGLPASVRTVNLAGEPLPRALARRLRAAGVPRVLNLYGPTEDTIYSTWAQVEEGEGEPPIGRPLDGTSAHVLDPQLRPAPVGVPGELCLGGAGLARGYLGSPDLTAERFVPDPAAAEPGARLYRTGDRARRLPDGSLELLGRLDRQVKVRGFRVEPGEIEALLREHPRVREAAVVVPDGDSGALLACIVPEDGVDPADLARFLRGRLPAFMVPNRWVPLDRLPLTPNGKVDRRALARLAPESATSSGAPRTPVEELLAELVAEVLGRERVGLDESFFDLGGHSLLAARLVARVRSAFGVDLPVGAVFEAPTVALLAAAVARGPRTARPPLERVSRREPVPASFGQRRLWFLDRLEPGSPAYHIAAVAWLEGRLDVAALAAALAGVVRRHEALRTVLDEVDGEPVLRVGAARPVPLPYVDLSALAGPERADEADRLMRAEARRPFDLARGPLLRTVLLGLGAQRHLLHLVLHHAVADGESLGVLVGELGVLYAAARGGRPAPLPEPPIQYGDFAAWQRRWLTGEALAAELAPRRRRFAGLPPPLDLPADRPRGAAGGPGAVRLFVVPAELRRQTQAICRRRGATLFMGLLAAFEALVLRYTGREDFCVGVPVAGRTQARTEGLIGLFANTLVLRADLAGDPAFGGLLLRAREESLAAFAHQDLPLEQLVEALRPERDLDRAPLFQVLFGLQGAERWELVLPGLRGSARGVDTGAAKLDLSLLLVDSADGLAGTVSYRADLFDPARIDRLAGHFETLLRGVAADPERRLSDLPLLSAGERHQVLHEWSGGAAGEEPREPAHRRVVAQTRRIPDAVAIESEEGALSFGELARRAARLARELRRHGVAPGRCVGLCAERSADAVIGILGILEAGGAWLPLDPALPAERLAWMLGDAGARLAVVQGRYEPLLAGAGVDLLRLGGAEVRGEPAGAGTAPAPLEGPAYVLYTSGSTGRPKGVVVSHRSLAAYLEWAGEWWPEPLPLLASLGFDASLKQLLAPLVHGRPVWIPAAGSAVEPEELLAELAGRPGAALNCVPSLWRALLERIDGGAAAPRLRRLLLGGEAVDAALLARTRAVLPDCEVWNLYGPTEATANAGVARLGADGVSIGRPAPGTRLLALDRGLAPVPPGVPGELAIGGAGLALGYLGRPDLTADRFVPDLFATAPGARLYRSGDLVRTLPDGRFEYLGRIDRQLKVRGVRIEPAEIEAALREHPSVREAALVLAGPPAAARLVAFATAAAGRPPAGPEELRSFLAGRLPAALVPSAVVLCESLPLTPAGKLDREALVRRAGESAGTGTGSGAATPLEELLGGLFGELLGRDARDARDAVGAEEDFFALGGHSLLAMRLVARLRSLCGLELPVRAVFEAPSPRRLARRLEEERGGRAPLPPVEPVPRDGPLPASFAQRRLWLLDRLEPASAVYNVPSAVRFLGMLDVAAFAGALSEVVRRHESLRTTLVEGPAGEPVQVVAAAHPVRPPLVDLRHLPAAARGAEALRIARQEAGRPFDLARGPLLRALLLAVGGAEHQALLCLHHAVTDGWSMAVLWRELGALYGAAVERRPSPLAELPVQVPDFAVWQRRWLGGDVLDAEVAWWRERLEGLPALDLPADRPRPAVRRSKGASRRLALAPALAERLRACGRERGATLFMTLLAGFAALLQRQTEQEDFAVGTPVAGRSRAETEGLVGCFVNTLVLRVDLAGDPSFAELLRRVRQRALEAYLHQELPFERLIEELRPERSLSRTPLFQVMLAFHDLSAAAPVLPGLTGEPLPVDTGTAKFDLSLALAEVPSGLAGVAELDRDLFDAATVDRLLGHFSALLSAAVVCPEAPLAGLSLLGPAERHQLVCEWNDTALPRTGAQRLESLVAAQAERTPDAVAVSLGEVGLTYAGLVRRAAHLSRRLRRLGVGSDVPVPICADRSPELLVGLLAILQAGGAWVPLDPSYPRERLALMLEDALAAGAPAVLVQPGLEEACRPPAGLEAPLVRLEGPLSGEGDAAAETPEGAAPDHLAYVLFTSGSTGRPKGAMNTHRAICNRLLWMQEAYRLDATDRVLQKTPVSFDVSVWELFWPLLAGARLVLARPGGHRDSRYLVDAVAGEGITTLHFVPSMLEAFLEEPDLIRCRSLRRVVASGEALPRELRDRFQGLLEAELHNLYGPTEAAVDVTFRPCAAPAPGLTVAIGRPIANLEVHLLDRAGLPVPLGVAGELHIGGVGLARGYLRRPELTAERFLPHPLPLRPGERLYRTGDLARRLPDGEVEFLGRVDDQVKVRGVRVEPGEVEAVVAAHPAVRQAAVVARPGRTGGMSLVAWVVPRGEGDPAADLRRFLAARLPEPMVPSAVGLLDRLPLLPNGKVDRRALAALPLPDSAAGEGPAGARTPLEELLAGLFADLLGRERVGTGDDFFALGGHSLLATRLVSRLRTACGVELPLRAVFESPTVAELAAAVERERRAGALPPRPAIERVPRSEPPPLSFAQQRLWFLDRLGTGGAAYNIPAAVRLEGPLDRTALAAALGEVVRRHEALRTTFAEAPGGPVQVIAPAAPHGLPVVELAGLPEPARGGEAARLVQGLARRAFDLARGPLLRAALLALGAREHVLVLVLHHAVGDGWSMDVLGRELEALYGAARHGRVRPLPEPPVQYADFAVWQRRWLAGAVLEGETAWWRERLAGAPPALELPADRPRPSLQSFRGARRAFELSGPPLAGLRALSRRLGSTLFMTLLAGFQALLSRHAGQPDVTVGAPIAGRTAPETEGLIGLFANTLALRADLSADPPFDALVARVRSLCLDAYLHQDLPFEKLVEELQPQRDLGRHPLFQAAFQLVPAPPPLRLEGLATTPWPAGTETVKFDLDLALVEEGERLTGSCAYARDLFDAATIERLLLHFETLLAGAAARPETPVAELPLLPEAERHQLLFAWNDRSAPAVHGCLHQRFREWVERIPGTLAVVDGAERLTYEELGRRAERLASRFRALGVGPEETVGLLLDRGAGLVVAILAVLEAGGAWVPLDPAHPPERLALLIADSGARTIVTGRDGGLPAGTGLPVVRLGRDEVDPAAPVRRAGGGTSPHNLTYVLYTSGSTGRPKGVGCTHAGVLNLLADLDARQPVAPGDACAWWTTPGFDVSVYEIFSALLSGGTLHVVPPEVHPDGRRLAAWLAERRIRSAYVPPFLLQDLADVVADGRHDFALSRLLVGVEPIPEPLLASIAARLPELRIVNGYGPTETTVCATLHNVRALPARPRRTPIGGPLRNGRVYLLDAAMRPVPLGAAGELYAGGAGLARGYHGRPDLTAERFVPDPFAEHPGERLYRTGDLARHLGTGDLEFLGRRDHQVKRRGHRIELAEIEAALVDLPAIRQAALSVRGENATPSLRLLACVVPAADPAPAAEELREALRRRLPDSMLPDGFVFLEALPLTPGGKVDRAALGALPWSPPRRGAAPVRPPVTEMEKEIAAIWCEVLEIAAVGVEDNFFDLGGHSLALLEVQRRLREALGREVAAVDLFRAPTIAALALHLAGDEAAETLARQGEERGAARLRRRRGRRTEAAVAVDPREEIDVGKG